jgi:hypothetical protein
MKMLGASVVESAIKLEFDVAGGSERPVVGLTNLLGQPDVYFGDCPGLEVAGRTGVRGILND